MTKYVLFNFIFVASLSCFIKYFRFFYFLHFIFAFCFYKYFFFFFNGSTFIKNVVHNISVSDWTQQALEITIVRIEFMSH